MMATFLDWMRGEICVLVVVGLCHGVFFPSRLCLVYWLLDGLSAELIPINTHEQKIAVWAELGNSRECLCVKFLSVKFLASF